MSVRGVFVNASDRRDFAVGDEIFRKGDMGQEMFGLVSGKVELRYGNEVVATVDPSGTFGEMAIVSDSASKSHSSRRGTVACRRDRSIDLPVPRPRDPDVRNRGDALTRGSASRPDPSALTGRRRGYSASALLSRAPSVNTRRQDDGIDDLAAGVGAYGPLGARRRVT